MPRNLQARLFSSMLLIAALVGCGKSEGEAEEELSLDYVTANIDPAHVDHYLPLEKRALVGVDKKGAAAALAGNGYVARTIASEFASLNRVSEAKYWSQIGAENGDGISMQNLSVMLREENCVRANYWLAKALETSHLPSLARASMEKDLEKYKHACGDGQAAGNK